MKKFIFALIFFGVSNASFAFEPRIRVELYSPDVVYPVYTQIGIASLIQFEDDETLDASNNALLGIGDAQAWNLGVRGKSIVLKPADKLPQTNIVVVTNKRTYSFDLLPASKKNSATYVLRFRYLDTEAKQLEKEVRELARRAEILEKSKPTLKKLNTNYVWIGDAAAIKPTAAYDDGRFTRFEYDNAAELPLFFKVMPDGSEALLNTTIEKNNGRIVTIHEVIRRVRVRLGSQVIEVINDNYETPAFNDNKTGTNEGIRVERGAQK